MKSFFADPTINLIDFFELNTNNGHEFNKFSQNVVTPEIISLVAQLLSGFSIEIKEEAIKFRFLSIILGNEELHNKLNELFPPNYSERNVNIYLKNTECFYHFSYFKTGHDMNSLLTFISSHFEELNKENFLKFPRYLQHKIITHPLS